MTLVPKLFRRSAAAWFAAAFLMWSSGAQASPAAGKWRHDSDDTSCSLYFNSDTAFVYISANADGSTTFRVHRSDWLMPDEAAIAIQLDSGSETAPMSARKAVTSNGWNGALASLKSSPLQQLAEAQSVRVTVDGTSIGDVSFADIDGEIAKFESCRAAMPHIDPVDYPVSSPTPAANLGELLSGARLPTREFVFRLRVDAKGETTECLVLQSSGSTAIDKDLCTRLRKARFKPARNRAGEPVAATFQTRIPAAR